MSKLHKSQRRSVRPKMSMKPMLSMKKPKATDASVGAATAATAAKEAGKFGKAMGTVGGVLGIAGGALSLVQGIKGLKSKRQKPAVKKEDLQVAGRVQKPKQTKKKKNTDKLLSTSKPRPTRQDSIASAYHHNHMFHKNKHYMNDPYYDASKKRAKKVAKKFPELDKYMRVRKNRKKLGYDYN